MKTSYIIEALLSIALVVACVKLAMGGNTSNATANADSIVINNILTRTSVRAYQDKPVEKAKIETMLRAAMAAPSAVNKQPWHFVVITDKAQLAALQTTNPNAKFISSAPLAIVVCGDETKMLKDGGRDFWIQDCSAATQNLLLAAHGLGLGAVWTGLWPAQERSEAVKQTLKLSDNLIPLCTVVIGYPEGETAPKDKWDESNITYMEEGSAPVTAEKKEAELLSFDVAKDFRANGFTFFADNAPILLAGDKESYNAMTIGWGAIGNIWGRPTRPTVTVYVAQKRYTKEFMEIKKRFTVMTFKDKKIAEYMGQHSGRDTDKAKDLGLTVAYTEHGTPYFKEADMVIECETMYGGKFSEAGFRNDVPKNLYSDFPAGIHSFYMGEVVSAMKRQ